MNVIQKQINTIHDPSEDCAICMVALGVDPKKLYICEQCKKPLHTECVQQQRIASCALCRSPIKDIKFRRQECDEYKMENIQPINVFSNNDLIHTHSVSVRMEIGIDDLTVFSHESVHTQSFDVPREMAIDVDGNTFYPSPPDTPVYDEENPNGDGWDYGDY